MRMVVRWLMIVAVVLGLSACGGGGSGGGGGSDPSKQNPDPDPKSKSYAKPLAPKLISVSSVDRGTAYVEWLPSENELDQNITYEVHASTTKGFPPSSSTLKTRTSDHEAQISGLDADKTYYILVQATNPKGSASSLSLPVKVASVTVRKNSGVNIVVQETSQIIKVDDDTVTFSGKAKVGDYLVGDSEHPYLRKVVSVKDNGAQMVAQTQEATIGEVYSDIQFNLAYNLEDPSQTPQAQSRITKNYRLSQYRWKSGSILQSHRPLRMRLGKVVISSATSSSSGDYFKITTPDAISVNKGDHLKYKLNISQTQSTYSSTSSYKYNEKNECDAVGGTHEEENWGIDNCLDIPVKLCSVGIDEIEDLEKSGSSKFAQIDQRRK